MLFRFYVRKRLTCENQTRRVKEKFMQSIQTFQDVEKAHRAKQKQRMERQFRIGAWCRLIYVTVYTS